MEGAETLVVTFVGAPIPLALNVNPSWDFNRNKVSPQHGEARAQVASKTRASR